MSNSNLTKLLFGPHTPPKLRRGDRAFCLYKDYPIRITGTSNGRIVWPVGVSCELRLGRSSILVDEELARAI